MIETERLILRPPIEADFEASYAMWSDPEVVRYISGVPSTREQAWLRLLRGPGMWGFKGYGPLTVIGKRDGRFVGETGHNDFHRGLGETFDPCPEAGWVFASHAHGKGYATEHAWFDANRPEARSVCIIGPENGPSLRLAARVGYRPFGRVDYNGEVVMLERLRSGRGS
jgi:RimJ/RimL family protein N-acetyltransferase